MNFGLEGKFVVVTGSTAGIGRAIATVFAKLGAYVVVNGRTQSSCDTAIAHIVEASKCDRSRLIAITADASSAEGAAAFLEAITATGRPVDVLVNNVGMFHVEDFTKISDEKWMEYYNTNTMSGVRLTRGILPTMLQRNSGRVLFISSEAGMRPLPHMVPYCVSKTSQISLARGLAELTKGTRVTVNSVLPGPTMTEGVQVYLKDFAAEKGIPTFEEAVKRYFAEYEPTSLIQRFLEPEEVANVVVFLASEMGAGINGSAQNIEGGIIRHI